MKVVSLQFADNLILSFATDTMNVENYSSWPVCVRASGQLPLKVLPEISWLIGCPLDICDQIN